MSDQMLPAKALPSTFRARLRTVDPAWLLATVQIMLVVATSVLFWPTSVSLLHRWEPSSNTAYGHGYVVLAISLWLLISNRYRWRHLTPKPSIGAAILLIPVAVIWLVMLRAAIESGHQVLIPVLIWLAICAALGPAIAVRNLLPVGYLYFALPVWDEINPVLQWATTAAADFLLTLSGVQAYVQANFVHLAVGTFEIAGGCSGLHFLMVATALAVLLGEVNRDTARVRMQLLALAALLAVLTNWIRVYIIILAGYLTDMQHYLVRVEHYRFGWVVFAVMMLLFFLIARRLPASQPAVVNSRDQDVPEIPQAAVVKGVMIALAALALIPLWSLLLPVRSAPMPPITALLPRNPGSWSGPAFSADQAWKPIFAGADLKVMGEYTAAGRRVAVYTAVYLSQSQGRELVAYGNSVAGEKVRILSEERSTSRVPMNEMVIETGLGEAVIRYFYRVDGKAINREAVAALTYGLRSVVGRPIASVIAARAACVPDCDSARRALDDLLQSMDLPPPAFAPLLPGDR